MSRRLERLVAGAMSERPTVGLQSRRARFSWRFGNELAKINLTRAIINSLPSLHLRRSLTHKRTQVGRVMALVFVLLGTSSRAGHSRKRVAARLAGIRNKQRPQEDPLAFYHRRCSLSACERACLLASELAQKGSAGARQVGRSKRRSLRNGSNLVRLAKTLIISPPRRAT